MPPFATTLQTDEFNNGGVDLRFRWNYGEGTMLRGSTLTFGGTAYHGDAPFNRYSTFDLTADLCHALLDGLEIRIGDDLLRGQHGGMCQRSLDIDEREAFVEEHR